MLKTETRTKTMSSRMSRNNDLRAKTRYRCRPTAKTHRALSVVDLFAKRVRSGPLGFGQGAGNPRTDSD